MLQSMKALKLIKLNSFIYHFRTSKPLFLTSNSISYFWDSHVYMRSKYSLQICFNWSKTQQKLGNEGSSPTSIGKFLIFQKSYLKNWIKEALLWSLGVHILHFLYELWGYSVNDGITTIFYEKIMSSMRPQRYFLGKFSHICNIYTTICL